jgi:hypothetical protein
MRREFVLKAQGLYFMVTGSWPVLHMPSFEAVTGPKVDNWLVKMVGLLAFVIGATIFSAAKRDSITRDVLFLAIGSALAFTAIDVWYSLSGRISLIYLADAMVEMGIVVVLVFGVTDT